MRITLSIALYVLREQWHGRTVRGGLALLLGIFLLAGLMQSLAIADEIRGPAAMFGALARVGLAALAMLAVVSGMARETEAHSTELIVAARASRRDYLLGRFLGHAAVVLILAATAGGLAAILGAAALAWTAALALELLVCTAAALFFASLIVHVVPAFALASGFYVLARETAVIRDMTMSPLADPGSVSLQIAGWIAQALSLVLPGLHRYAGAGRLTGDGGADLAGVALEAAVYTVFALAAAVMDFSRREF